MFSIRDAKAEIFNPPFFKTTAGEAERDFHQAVNDPSTMLNKYPTDYDLYYLGEYDDMSGKFSNLESPQHVIKAVQLIKQPELGL